MFEKALLNLMKTNYLKNFEDYEMEGMGHTLLIMLLSTSEGSLNLAPTTLPLASEGDIPSATQ